MAERVRISIPAGARESHTIHCQPSEGSGDKRGGGGLGKLEWRAVVMEERIVDLEVKMVFRPKEDGGDTCVEWLQQKASGGNHWGSFRPADHPKMKQEMPEKLDRLEAVVFEFDNSYSWWTPKEVELICIREDTGPTSRPAAPLPPVPRPGSPTPRHPGTKGEGLGGEPSSPLDDVAGAQTQFMQIFTPPASPREGAAFVDDRLRAPDLHALVRWVNTDSSPQAKGRGGAGTVRVTAADIQALRVLAQLDAWLAAAEVVCPAGREGVEVLTSRISELRDFCRQKLPEVLPR